MVDFLTKEDVYYPSAAISDDDFIDFSFGDKKASDFNIIRVSNGSRFDENLLPTIQDKTVQVPGADGTYYFGSYYTQRQFSIPIAFNAMTEANLREMRQWLGDKKIKNLVFSEAPYKVYRAKCTGTATIKHICFMENDERIYKGEGTLQFTAYVPFARTTDGKKFTDDYGWILSISEGDIEIEETYQEKGWSIRDVKTVLSNIATGNPTNLEYGFYLLKRYFGITFKNNKDKELEKAYQTKKHIEEWAPAAGLLGSSIGFDTEKAPYATEFESYIDPDDPDPTIVEDVTTLQAMKAFSTLSKNYEKFLTGRGPLSELGGAYQFPFYNPSDMPTDFQLYIPFDSNGKISLNIIQIFSGSGGATAGESLHFDEITRSSADTISTGIRINSATNLLEGVTKNRDGSFTLTGFVYNNYILSGSFFKLPVTREVTNSSYILVGPARNKEIQPGLVLKYDYLYF